MNYNPEKEQYFYGSRYRDEYLLHDPESLPRYGHLVRKILMHYAGDHYNPHTICITQEPFMRKQVKFLIEYRLLNQTKGYDWEWIDNFFKQMVGSFYDLDLPFDMERLDQGFAPEFKAKIPLDWDKPN